MTTVDARGYSCPEPVIMLRKAMAKKDAEYTVLVDNAASKENVTRYAEHEGYSGHRQRKQAVSTPCLIKK